MTTDLPIVCSSERHCGECTACCTAVGVKELGKPYFAACEHLCVSGCIIYDERPISCRAFHCYWRTGLLSETSRPDTFGWIFFSKTNGLLEAYATGPTSLWNDECRRAAIKILTHRLAERSQEHNIPIDELRAAIPQQPQLFGVQVIPFEMSVKVSYATRAPYPIRSADNLNETMPFRGQVVRIDHVDFYEFWPDER